MVDSSKVSENANYGKYILIPASFLRRILGRFVQKRLKKVYMSSEGR